MNISFFLYRRLCRWITCDLRLPFQSSVSLSTKYDVGSFQDVFCHPYYWQVFSWLREPPKLVVDCGANCGHFAILMDTCVRVRFGRSETQYVLVEPNPALRPILERNLRNAGLVDRASIISGLLGPKSGSSTLWIHPKNFLASSMTRFAGATPHVVPFVDLVPHLGGSHIDIMKVDIEGGEYPFVRENADVLARTGMLMMEIHDATVEARATMFGSIQASGLLPMGHDVNTDGLWLRAWERPGGQAPVRAAQSARQHALT
ncbi:MAG: FkbM family methyltransferase [Gammaproteobacteria bacterium]